MRSQAFAGILFLLVLVSLLTPSAKAFCEIAEPPTSVPTQVNGTQVEIRLVDGFARIVIIKEFYNPSPIVKEGQVFFPLEPGHELLTDLRLKVGNVVYNSSALESAEALEGFLEALRSGQDSALLQYDRARDVYWIAVTIPAFSARTTVATLEMPLTEQDGYYDYNYHLSVDARDSAQYLRVHVTIQATEELREVEVPSHPDLAVLRGGNDTAEININSTLEAQGHDLHVRFRTSGPSVSQYLDPVDGYRYVRYNLGAGDPLLQPSHLPSPRAALIAVDASGSMGKEGRWAAARDSVVEFLRGLNPGESFALAMFHGQQTHALSETLLPPSLESEGLARRFLGAQIPQGSTNFSTPVSQITTWARQAREHGQQPILLLVSDGGRTSGTDDLLHERQYSRLFYEDKMPVLALGVRPSQHADENRLRNLSHFNGGDYVALYEDIPWAIASLHAVERIPVMEEIRFALPEAADVEIASPNPQSVLRGGAALMMVRIQAGAAGSLTIDVSWPGIYGEEEIHRFRLPVNEIPTQPLLKREWVLVRVHQLLSALRGGEDPALVSELQAFALAHRIVTPYSSLLVRLPPQRTSPSAEFRAGPAASQGLAFCCSFGFDSGSSGAFAPSSERRPGLSGGNEFRPRQPPSLTSEERSAAGWRSDLSLPLIANGEIDRHLTSDSEEGKGILASGDVPLVRGTHVTIVESDGEIVAVHSDTVEHAQFSSVGWLFLSLVLVIVTFRIHRLRKRTNGQQKQGSRGAL